MSKHIYELIINKMALCDLVNSFTQFDFYKKHQQPGQKTVKSYGYCVALSSSDSDTVILKYCIEIRCCTVFEINVVFANIFHLFTLVR